MLTERKINGAGTSSLIKGMMMRCYLVASGHFRAVEVITAESDAEAVERAFSIFRQQAGHFDGFELWDQARLVHSFKPDYRRSG